ncbi:MAG: hypothetical protein R3F17_08190 [Planctomycetota bacterium]
MPATCRWWACTTSKPHVYAATMQWEDPPPAPTIALVVSRSTALYEMDRPRKMTPLASTLDDAAGESVRQGRAPAEPRVSRRPVGFGPRHRGQASIAFPRYRAKDGRPGFSFSGLKTAVLYHLRGGDALAPTPAPQQIPDRADVAASFQAAVVDNLVRPTLQAARERGARSILIAGGVAANRSLRAAMAAAAEAEGIETRFPAPAYCTDNAVMIAGLGWHALRAGDLADWGLDASPR